MPTAFLLCSLSLRLHPQIRIIHQWEFTLQSVRENSSLHINSELGMNVGRAELGRVQHWGVTPSSYKLVTASSLAGVFICLLVLCFVFSPHSIQPVQLTHFLLSRMFFTVSMCRTQWKILPTHGAYTFLLRAFHKSLRNSAVCHLGISVFKSTTGFASVMSHTIVHLSPQ